MEVGQGPNWGLAPKEKIVVNIGNDIEIDNGRFQIATCSQSSAFLNII
jgi:hypothetical protein